MTIVARVLRPQVWCTALASVLLALGMLATPLPARAEKPQIAVVALKARGGPNLKGVIRRFFEKPMIKSGKVNVLSARAFKKGARSAKVRGKKLRTLDGSKAAAQAAGASHLLVLEGMMEKAGRKKRFYANISLTDLQSGDVVFSGQYALKGRKLNKVTSANILEEVYTTLEGGGEDIPEPDPVDDEAGDQLVDDGGAEEEPVDLGTADAGGADTAASDGSVLSETGDAAAAEGSEDIGLAAIEDAAYSPSVVEEVPVERTDRVNGKVRPALQLVVGSIFLQRNGEIKSPPNKAAGRDPPPCYCGAKGDSNPFFPAGYLALEVYPLAFGGTGRIYEGIGLHMEAYYTKVKTLIDSTSNKTISSDLTGLRGGATFRFVFWDSDTAPDIKLNVGASYFQFPLRQGAFPGVKYTSLYSGLRLDAPLFTPMVGLIASFNYAFSVTPGGKTIQLGTGQAVATVRQIDGGIRLSFSPIEVRLLFKHEYTFTRYTGTSRLVDSTVQFEDTRLRDRIMGFALAVGVAL